MYTCMVLPPNTQKHVYICVHLYTLSIHLTTRSKLELLRYQNVRSSARHHDFKGESITESGSLKPSMLNHFLATSTDRPKGPSVGLRRCGMVRCPGNRSWKLHTRAVRQRNEEKKQFQEDCSWYKQGSPLKNHAIYMGPKRDA